MKANVVPLDVRQPDTKERILDIVPSELHQKVPLVVGSKEDVEQYQDFFLGGDGPQKPTKGKA